MKQRFLGAVLAVGLVCGTAGNAKAQGQIGGFNTCKNSFTEDQEIAEGQKVSEQVFQAMPVLKDSDPVSIYVRQLGMKLTKNAPGYSWPYNFHVVDSAEINAFALPGGSVFVNLATVTAAESEAQLAGVMGHEISHVVLRHSTCNITKQKKGRLFAGLGQVAAQTVGGSYGNLASNGIGYVAGLTFLKMSRESEQQADLEGTQILYDSGYDPRGMPQFFEVIQQKYGAGSAQFLSDHPNPGNRVQYVNAKIETLPPRKENTRSTPAFEKAHASAASRAPLTAEQTKAGAWKSSSSYQHSSSANQ